MQIVVLMAFIVSLTLSEVAPLVAGRWLVMPAVVAYLAGAVAMGAFRTARSLRALARDPDSLAGLPARHNLLALLGQGWLVAGLGGVIVLGYGRWVLEDLALRRVPLAGEAAILGPFVVALILSWALEYPLYRTNRARIAHRQLLTGLAPRRPWTLREYLSYNLRHHLLFVAVPVGLIVLFSDSLDLLGPLLPASMSETIVAAGSLASAAGVFLCAPLLIVRIWRTAPLPPGPLREDLLRVCREMKFTCRQLLIWRSGGMIANAGVMGLLGRLRYVLLSDALLEQMDDREIKSIFAHEAGHIVSHHLVYAFVFAISSVALCSSVGELAAIGLDRPVWLGQVIGLALLVGAWAFGFGWISRRFERQSDVIAAWSMGPDGPERDGRITPEGAIVFARALGKVAHLNGISPRQWNWRHGSIAGRIAYVMWLGSTAGNRAEIDRTVRRIKISLWVALLLAVAVGVLAARFA